MVTKYEWLESLPTTKIKGAYCIDVECLGFKYYKARGGITYPLLFDNYLQDAHKQCLNLNIKRIHTFLKIEPNLVLLNRRYIKRSEILHNFNIPAGIVHMSRYGNNYVLERGLGEVLISHIKKRRVHAIVEKVDFVYLKNGQVDLFNVGEYDE